MAKCNQLTSLPFKGLTFSANEPANRCYKRHHTTTWHNLLSLFSSTAHRPSSVPSSNRSWSANNDSKLHFIVTVKQLLNTEISTHIKYPMGCEAQLVQKCPLMPNLFPWAILTHKVSQRELVFDV